MSLNRRADSSDPDLHFMRRALQLAARAFGWTSPNPMVGAILVRDGRIIGQGWHRRAGAPHAEVEALAAARRDGFDPAGATLYVTLEPCSTHGRTPPCTSAILAADIRRVVVAAIDPNPAHSGRGLRWLTRRGIAVRDGLLAEQATALNRAFNHWIVHRTPFVTVKAAMTLDGKIATAQGQSRWITTEQSRHVGMRLRLGADAILVGVRTILADNPQLVVRPVDRYRSKRLRRLILDSRARTPLDAQVVSDEWKDRTVVVVGRDAPRRRLAALRREVEVWTAPSVHIDLAWLCRQLGAEGVTSLLVEGGGEVNSAFLSSGLVQEIAFFIAPRVFGGRDARKSVAGALWQIPDQALALEHLRWRRIGRDLLLTAQPVFRTSQNVTQNFRAPFY